MYSSKHTQLRSAPSNTCPAFKYWSPAEEPGLLLFFLFFPFLFFGSVEMDTLTLVECQRITAGRCCHSALRPNFPWSRSLSRSLPLACSASSAFFSSRSSCAYDHLMMLSNFCSAWICGGEARYLSVSHDWLPQWRAQQYARYCYFPLTHKHIRTAIFLFPRVVYYAFMTVWDALCTYVWLNYEFMYLMQLCIDVFMSLYGCIMHLCPCMYGCMMHLCPCGYAYIFMFAMKIAQNTQT